MRFREGPDFIALDASHMEIADVLIVVGRGGAATVRMTGVAKHNR